MSDEFVWPRDMSETLEKGKGKAYVIEEHKPNGIHVHEFPSKAKAHAFGMGLRRAGNASVFAFPADSPHRSAPGKGAGFHASGGGGDVKRDDKGRFAGG